MGLFTPITKALAEAGKPSLFEMLRGQLARERGVLADHLTIQWLATAISERTDLPFEDVAQMLVDVSADGGPDLRTNKGMACVSVILGVPGAPIVPTLH